MNNSVIVSSANLEQRTLINENIQENYIKTFPLYGQGIRSELTKGGDPSKKELPKKICDKNTINIGDKKFTPREHQIKTLYYFLKFTCSFPHLRGLLLFHRVGSGKTCTSIIIADILLHLYYRKMGANIDLNKDLPPNFQTYGRNPKQNSKLNKLNTLIKESSFFTPNKIIVISKAPLIREYIKEYCNKCGINTENFSKFFYFISHSTHNKSLADFYRVGIKPRVNNNDISPGYGEISFENSLIIIDEIHQFINYVSNSINKRSSTQTQLHLYNKINNTKNCKIIGLTGTPIYKGYDSLILLIHLFKRKEKYTSDIHQNPDKKYIPSEHNYKLQKVEWDNKNKKIWKQSTNESGKKEYIEANYRDEKQNTVKLHTIKSYNMENKMFKGKMRNVILQYKKILNENNKTSQEISYEKFINYEIEQDIDNYLQDIFGDWISVYNPFKEGNKSAFPKVISSYKNIIAIKMSKEHQDYFNQQYELEERINIYNNRKDKGVVNIEQEFKNNNSVVIRARLREFSLTASNFFYPIIDGQDTKLSAKFCDKNKDDSVDTKILSTHYDKLSNNTFIEYSKVFYDGWLNFMKKFKDEKTNKFIDKGLTKWKEQKKEWFKKNNNMMNLYRLDLENEHKEQTVIDNKIKKLEKSYDQKYDTILEVDNLNKFNNYIKFIEENKDSKEESIITKIKSVYKPFIIDWMSNKNLISLSIFKLPRTQDITTFKIKKRVEGWIDNDFFKFENKNKLNLINQKLFYMIINIIIHPYQKHVVFTKFITKSGIDLIQSMFVLIIKCLKKQLNEDNNEKYKKTIDFWNDKVILKYTGDDKHININSKKYSTSTLFNNKNNNYGQKYPIILVSEAGFTGLNLLCVRHQHFFNQLANPITKEQALGRGIRFQSHYRLKESERNVTIWEYFNCTDTDKFKLFLNNPKQFIVEEKKEIDKIKSNNESLKKMDFLLGGIDYELYIKHKMVTEDYIYLYSLLDKYDINTTVDILDNDYQKFKNDILKYYQNI